MLLFLMHSLMCETSIPRILHVGKWLISRSSSNARLERKLNLLISEVRAGKREGSIISEPIFDSKVQSDQETWDILRRELEDVGISAEVIVEKRVFLVGWFQEAVAAGRLDEDVSPPSDEDPIIEGALPSTPAEDPRSESSTMSMARQEAQGNWEFQFEDTLSPSRRFEVDMTSAEDDRSSNSDHENEITETYVQYQIPITLGTRRDLPVDFNDQSMKKSLSCHDEGIGSEVEQMSAPSAGADGPKLGSSTLGDSLRPIPLALSHLPPAQRHSHARVLVSPTVRRPDEENDTLIDDAEGLDKGLLKYFLAEGADPVGIYTIDETALDHAATGVLLDRRLVPFMIVRSDCSYGPENNPIVAVFVMDRGSDMGLSSYQKTHAITFAAAYSGLIIANVLLWGEGEVIADPVARGKELSALLLAAQAANNSIMRFLVQYGAAVNRKFIHAATTGLHVTLALAAQGGNEYYPPRVIYLSEDAHSPFSAFMTRTDSMPQSVSELNLEAHRLTGEKGETALMRAAKMLNVPAVRSLLQLGVNVKTTSRFGETALVLLLNETSGALSKRQRIEASITIMRFLVHAGASLDEADRSGKKAWQIAEESGSKSALSHDQFKRYQSLMSAVRRYGKNLRMT